MDKEYADDEFFGSQSDDDSPTESKPFLSPNNLSQHEVKSKEDHFWKVGYHEAHENSRHSKVQQGFEFGYRSSLEASYRIGEFLGQHTLKNSVFGVKRGNEEHISTAGPVKMIRKYLEAEQTQDPMDMDAKAMKNGVEQLEKRLQKL